jgi:hypothetical protein
VDGSEISVPAAAACSDLRELWIGGGEGRGVEWIWQWQGAGIWVACVIFGSDQCSQ